MLSLMRSRAVQSAPRRSDCASLRAVAPLVSHCFLSAPKTPAALYHSTAQQCQHCAHRASQSLTNARILSHSSHQQQPMRHMGSFSRWKATTRDSRAAQTEFNQLPPSVRKGLRRKAKWQVLDAADAASAAAQGAQDSTDPTQSESSTGAGVPLDKQALRAMRLAEFEARQEQHAHEWNAQFDAEQQQQRQQTESQQQQSMSQQQQQQHHSQQSEKSKQQQTSDELLSHVSPTARMVPFAQILAKQQVSSDKQKQVTAAAAARLRAPTNEMHAGPERAAEHFEQRSMLHALNQSVAPYDALIYEVRMQQQAVHDKKLKKLHDQRVNLQKQQQKNDNEASVAQATANATDESTRTTASTLQQHDEVEQKQQQHQSEEQQQQEQQQSLDSDETEQRESPLEQQMRIANENLNEIEQDDEALSGDEQSDIDSDEIHSQSDDDDERDLDSVASEQTQHTMQQPPPSHDPMRPSAAVKSNALSAQQQKRVYRLHTTHLRHWINNQVGDIKMPILYAKAIDAELDLMGYEKKRDFDALEQAAFTIWKTRRRLRLMGPQALGSALPEHRAKGGQVGNPMGYLGKTDFMSKLPEAWHLSHRAPLEYAVIQRVLIESIKRLPHIFHPRLNVLTEEEAAEVEASTQKKSKPQPKDVPHASVHQNVETSNESERRTVVSEDADAPSKPESKSQSEPESQRTEYPSLEDDESSAPDAASSSPLHKKPTLRPFNVLDYGSSTGAAEWALQQTLPPEMVVRMRQLVSIESNQKFAALAQRLTKNMMNRYSVQFNTRLTDDMLSQHCAKMHVVLAPYALSRETRRSEQRKIVHQLWSTMQPDHSVMILIERATPHGFTAIRHARAHLLAEYKTECNIIAPCAHRLACPQAKPLPMPKHSYSTTLKRNGIGAGGSRHGWSLPRVHSGICQFKHRVLASSLPHRAKCKDQSHKARRSDPKNRLGGYLLEGYSYLVVTRGTMPESMHRDLMFGGLELSPRLQELHALRQVELQRLNEQELLRLEVEEQEAAEQLAEMQRHEKEQRLEAKRLGQVSLMDMGGESDEEQPEVQPSSSTPEQLNSSSDASATATHDSATSAAISSTAAAASVSSTQASEQSAPSDASELTAPASAASSSALDPVADKKAEEELWSLATSSMQQPLDANQLPPLTAQQMRSILPPEPADIFQSRMARLVAPTYRNKRKEVVLSLCTPQGTIEQWAIGKGRYGLSGGWDIAKKARWGDLFPCMQRFSPRALVKRQKREEERLRILKAEAANRLKLSATIKAEARAEVVAERRAKAEAAAAAEALKPVRRRAGDPVEFTEVIPSKGQLARLQEAAKQERIAARLAAEKLKQDAALDSHEGDRQQKAPLTHVDGRKITRQERESLTLEQELEMARPLEERQRELETDEELSRVMSRLENANNLDARSYALQRATAKKQAQKRWQIQHLKFNLAKKGRRGKGGG